MTEIQKMLFQFEDKEYREFNSKLIPNIDKATQIGVRIPDIRRIAKDIKNTDKAKQFMKELPHKYFEENNLHGYLLETIKDFDEAMAETEKFLPYIDNWATCDTISPKVFSKNPVKLKNKIREWIKSNNTYTIRFAISMLLKFFLDDNFDKELLKLVADIENEEYYVHMMRAWFFATAMAKQREAALPYFTEKRLDVKTHNKAIQKCVESFRISKEDKEFLKRLKVKN